MAYKDQDGKICGDEVIHTRIRCDCHIEITKLKSELEQAQTKIEQIKKWPECRNKKHFELETDGTVICQHCYRDVIDENARLKEAMKKYEHFETVLVGCYATDKPDMIADEIKDEYFWEIQPLAKSARE